jgi:hypothetical protein
MTIEQAATDLQKRLGEQPWLIAVGIGEEAGRPAIVPYVRSKTAVPTDILWSGWEHFPVVARKTSAPRPLASS